MAEILPIESADMWWTERYEGKVTYDGQYIVNEEPYYYISFIKPSETNYSQDTIKDIPCWSLAALLNTLPVSVDEGQHCLALINSNPSGEIEWLCCYEDDNGNTLMECYADNQIDACVEMILKTQRKRTMTRAEKLEEAKRLYETANADQRYVLESLFPELAESDDERIRKWLIDWAKAVNWSEQFTITKEQVIAWLEKQGNRKMVDADEVIAWLVANILDFEDKVKLFKKDFGL